MNDLVIFAAAERCAERLARESRTRRDARDARYWTLGEQVIRNPLIRDLTLQGLNPYKLSELQSVLGLREFYGLLPDVAEWHGRTACAAYLCEVTYTQLLAGEYGGDVDVNLFLSAASHGHVAMIDLLVERYGVDPNGADVYGRTALHRAAEYGHIRTVKHLVEKHNVDIHERDGCGWTALDFAAERGRTACADYLRKLQSTRPPSIRR